MVETANQLDVDIVLVAGDLFDSARVADEAYEQKEWAGHLRHQGIDLAEHVGPVRFTGPHTVRAGDGSSWDGDRVVVAVGCRSARLPVPGGELALTYQDIWTLKDLHGGAAVPVRMPGGLFDRLPETFKAQRVLFIDAI